VQTVSQRGDGQAARVGVAGEERTPGDHVNAGEQRRITQLKIGKGEATTESSFAPPRQAVDSLPQPAPGFGLGEGLPPRHRPLDHTRRLRVAANAQRRHEHRLVTDLRAVPQRNVAEPAVAVDAEHPRPDAAQGEGDVVQRFTGEPRVEVSQATLLAFVSRPPKHKAERSPSPTRGKPLRDFQAQRTMSNCFSQRDLP